ncbi:MAG: hypothetical protein AAFP84_18425 [Actinomycetota bacterium]
MNAAQDLHRLLDRALGDDTLDALVATRLLTTEVAGWVTDRAVLNSRRAGKSWAMIARILMISRQAAHRRFAHLDRITSITDLPRRPDPLGRSARQNRTGERLLNLMKSEQETRERLAGDEAVPW